MKNIDPKTPIWQLTVEEFLEVSKKSNAEKKYEYGLKGLAKIFGCSLSKASEIIKMVDKCIVHRNICWENIHEFIQIFINNLAFVLDERNGNLLIEKIENIFI